MGRNGVRGRSGSTTLATYAYNGLNQRIRKAVPGESAVTTDYYYNEAWQVLEEQQTIAGGAGPATYAQYVWDPRYIDAPVCRFRDPGLAGTLSETLYYTQDANMNVTALVNTSGQVVERYQYDPYGKVTFLQGAVDLSGAGTTDWGAAGAASACDNQILYAGYRFDPESGLYHVRNRPYHPTLGVWPVRDPAGYVDRLSLYAYINLRPTYAEDPLGLEATIVTAENIATQAEVDSTHGGATQMPQTASITVTISCPAKTWVVSDIDDTYVISVRILTLEMAKAKFVKDNPRLNLTVDQVTEEWAKGTQDEAKGYEQRQNAYPIQRLWNASAGDGRAKLNELQSSSEDDLKKSITQSINDDWLSAFAKHLAHYKDIDNQRNWGNKPGQPQKVDPAAILTALEKQVKITILESGPSSQPATTRANQPATRLPRDPIDVTYEGSTRRICRANHR